MQEVEGSTPTRGTCPNDFSDPIDQDIRTQWALSWKIVVSKWRSVTAVSLNVGGGVPLIKPAKLCMCTQNTTNTTRTDAQRQVCAAMILYCCATRGTLLRELEYTHYFCYVWNHVPDVLLWMCMNSCPWWTTLIVYSCPWCTIFVVYEFMSQMNYCCCVKNVPDVLHVLLLCMNSCPWCTTSVVYEFLTWEVISKVVLLYLSSNIQVYMVYTVKHQTDCC